MLPPRLRKALGLVALLVGLILYAALAVAIAVTWLPDHWLAQLVFYPAAGLAWLVPTIPIVRWMQAADGI